MEMPKISYLYTHKIKLISSMVLALASLLSQDAMAMCVDGNVSNCVVNGKHGTRECVAGHLTPCIVEPEVIPAVHGTVTPRYYILTVVYAPPGTSGGRSSSVVDYSDGSTTGSTVSSSSSFKSDTKVSVSASGGIFATASVGASFGIAASSTDSSKLEIKKTTTTSIKDSGPSVDGIDHDRDIIYLLLNPKIDMRISGKNVVWYMGYTGAYADIQYAYVGWLKTPSTMPPGLSSKLTALGFTDADYQTILKADPFATGSTTIDTSRYLSTNTSFPYEPPFSPGESGPTFTYVQKNDFTSTQSQGSQQAYSVGLNVSGEVGFTSLFKTTMKVDNTWTWTNSSEQSSSSGSSQSASVTVGSPSYGYAGPTDMAVYYDSLYKTFMFAPIPVNTVMAKGTLKSKRGRAISFQEVILYAAGKRYRTFSNEHGQYRFVGQYAGPIDVEIKGVAKKRVPAASKQLDFILPDAISIRTLPR